MARQWYYAIDGVAAGMGHPGYGSRLEEQLERLKGAGFTAMVSLSTAAPDVEAVARAGMKHLHVSVPDFGSAGAPFTGVTSVTCAGVASPMDQTAVKTWQMCASVTPRSEYFFARLSA